MWLSSFFFFSFFFSLCIYSHSALGCSPLASCLLVGPTSLSLGLFSFSRFVGWPLILFSLVYFSSPVRFTHVWDPISHSFVLACREPPVNQPTDAPSCQMSFFCFSLWFPTCLTHTLCFVLCLLVCITHTHSPFFLAMIRAQTGDSGSPFPLVPLVPFPFAICASNLGRDSKGAAAAAAGVAATGGCCCCCCCCWWEGSVLFLEGGQTEEERGWVREGVMGKHMYHPHMKPLCSTCHARGHATHLYTKETHTYIYICIYAYLYI